MFCCLDSFFNEEVIYHDNFYKINRFLVIVVNQFIIIVSFH